MRKYFYITSFLFSLILVGCSSTYRLNDFSSKGKFYENINESIKERVVKITLKNDSTFTTNGKGAQVEKDSLIIFPFRIVKDTTLPLSKVQHIAYSTNFQNRSAVIYLKDGSSFNADNVSMSKNSLLFRHKISYQHKIPITKVNVVSYESTTDGIVGGAMTGILTGFVITASKIIPANLQEGNPPYPNDYNYVGVGVVSIVAGILVGGIIGGLVGHSYTYQLNP